MIQAKQVSGIISLPDDYDSGLAEARDHYLMGAYQKSHDAAVQAVALAPGDWRATHQAALALRMLGRLREALSLLARLHRDHPEVPEIRRDLGDFVCKVLGDWSAAAMFWAPLTRRPDYAESMAWFQIKRRIYQGGVDAGQLSGQIAAYASRYLTLPGTTAPKASRRRGRQRIGLISTFFRATPLYYLGYGALTRLAADHDLIFFSRETVTDWATGEFRANASDWHDVKALDPDHLSAFLRGCDLDVLIDLGGWLDRPALAALSTRPAKRLYKWIGGQSTSTGLKAFDGFLSDPHQSPLELQSLYSEPLRLMAAGYASYTAPAYLPAPQRSSGRGPWQVGVIAHPMKLSPAYLDFLRHHAGALGDRAGRPVQLRFIGWRYGEPALQSRLERLFHPVTGTSGFSLAFTPTRSHAEYLKQVAELDWVVDTFPYTSGLTALEALVLGVPVRTRAGALFCERHAYSHCRYAGLEAAEIDLDRLGPFTPPRQEKTGRTLLPEDCPRRNHDAVAADLAHALEC